MLCLASSSAQNHELLHSAHSCLGPTGGGPAPMHVCLYAQVSTVDASGAELPAGALDVRGVQNYLPPHPLVSV